MAANRSMLHFITFKTPVDLYKPHSQRYMLFCMTSPSEHPSFHYSKTPADLFRWLFLLTHFPLQLYTHRFLTSLISLP
jgi:hypothetical protein